MESQNLDLPTNYRLRATSGPEDGRCYVLGEETRVGRDPHADVLMEAPSVGRWICILIWDESTHRHRIDQGWYRPVFVNGKQIAKGERVALQVGDQITIATTTFVYKRLAR